MKSYNSLIPITVAFIVLLAGVAFSYTEMKEAEFVAQEQIAMAQAEVEDMQRQFDVFEKTITEYEYIMNGFLLSEGELTLDRNDITVPSNITVEEMKLVTKGTELEGLAYGYVYAERVFNINALYLYAITANESAYGTSRLAREKNNISGFAAYDHSPYSSASYFETKTECLIASALNLKVNYTKAGLKSLDNVGTKYATDTSWADKVHAIASKTLENL